MVAMSRIPRLMKPGIARGVAQRLVQRQADGPPEPALDCYIDEVTDVADRLEVHVSGKSLADGAWATRRALRDTYNETVGACFRHIESYVNVEAHRHGAPHAVEALALYKAAFPDGITHLRDHVPEQNVRCRASLEVLRSPEVASTITAIGLPIAWIDSLEAALNASDAAQDELTNARTEKSVQVNLGRDVETDWMDTMSRLRRQVESRGRRGGAHKQAEGMHLLEPLLSVIKKMEAEYAARMTRKSKTKKTPQAPAAKPVPPVPPSGEAKPVSPVPPVPPSGEAKPVLPVPPSLEAKADPPAPPSSEVKLVPPSSEAKLDLVAPASSAAPAPSAIPASPASPTFLVTPLSLAASNDAAPASSPAS